MNPMILLSPIGSDTPEEPFQIEPLRSHQGETGNDYTSALYG